MIADRCPGRAVRGACASAEPALQSPARKGDRIQSHRYPCMAFLLDQGLEHVTALLPLAVVTTASRIKPRPVSTNTRAKPAPRVAALLVARAAKAEASPARYRNLGEQEPPDGGSRPTRVPHGNANSHADRHGHDCPSAPAIQQPAGRPPPLATNASATKSPSNRSRRPPDPKAPRALFSIQQQHRRHRRTAASGVKRQPARRSRSFLRCPGAPRPRTTRLPMQSASLHPVTPALLSARSAVRAGSADDRFHDRPTVAGATRVAPSALTRTADRACPVAQDHSAAPRPVGHLLRHHTTGRRAGRRLSSPRERARSVAHGSRKAAASDSGPLRGRRFRRSGLRRRARESRVVRRARGRPLSARAVRRARRGRASNVR